MTRPSWDDQFMAMARIVSLRATCDRRLIGCIITRNNRVIATGYNGAPSGHPHCDEAGHDLASLHGRDSCVRTLHAEQNAILQAKTDLEGCTVYTTTFPCLDCAKSIVASGVSKVVFDDVYPSSSRVTTLFERAGIRLQKYEPTVEIVEVPIRKFNPDAK